MYWGSVRFFKHLILFVIGAVLLTIITLAVTWGVLYFSTNAKLTQNEQNNYQIPKNLSTVEMYRTLLEKGYSMENFIGVFGSEDRKGLIEAYQSVIGLKNELPAYSESHPELYVEPPDKFVTEQKTVYLTFDDGPSNRTPEILDILKKHDIKATFFVVGPDTEKRREWLRQIAADGHTIGIHTYSHVYNSIYESEQNYLDDFAAASDFVFAATGQRPNIFRFPGGSINNYNTLVYRNLIAEMTRRGFTYFDWNVVCEDYGNDRSTDDIYYNVMGGMKNKDRAILLLHDSEQKNLIVGALDRIITTLKSQGYTFAALTNGVTPITYG